MHAVEWGTEGYRDGVRGYGSETQGTCAGGNAETGFELGWEGYGEERALRERMVCVEGEGAT